jgi:hypothetical protein
MEKRAQSLVSVKVCWPPMVLQVDNACALQQFSEGEINFIFHHTESKTVTASDFMILVHPYN